MKKKLCLMAAMTIFLLAGCNNASTTSTTSSTTKAPIPATTPAPTTVPVTTPAPTEPKDELWLLKTTFEIAERDGGIYLVRGEKMYTLNSGNSKVPGIDYHPIQLIKGNSKDVTFYYPARSLSGGYPSCGDNVPIPVLSDGDRIIVFSDDFYDLKLSPANLIGYSFFMKKYDKSYGGFDEQGNYFYFDNKIEFTVTDSKENIITDFSFLNKDEIYTLFYYEGTRYNEIKLKADCLQFDYDNVNIPGHTVSGNLTKNGYAEYYISSDIPAGLYLIGLADGGVLDGILVQLGE